MLEFCKTFLLSASFLASLDHAVAQQHRHSLGIGTPPSYPDLDEITGPFEITVVARVDDVARRWQRLFEFGTQLNTEVHHCISLAVPQSAASLQFRIHGYAPNGSLGLREVAAQHILDVGVVTTWTVGVDENYRMYLKKNGVEVDSRIDGVWAGAVNRQYKYIGQSVWDNDDDLAGAVLGLQFVKGGISSSKKLPLEWLNFPGQIFRDGFIVSGYARFHDVAGSWQRIFDFADNSGASVSFGQRGSSRDLRLEVDNGDGSPAATLDATNAIIDWEMAFWEVGVSGTGLARIWKNGVLVVSQSGFLMPTKVFRSNYKFGSSNNPAHTPLNGDVLGIRFDEA